MPDMFGDWGRASDSSDYNPRTRRIEPSYAPWFEDELRRKDSSFKRIISSLKLKDFSFDGYGYRVDIYNVSRDSYEFYVMMRGSRLYSDTKNPLGQLHRNKVSIFYNIDDSTQIQSACNLKKLLTKRKVIVEEIPCLEDIIQKLAKKRKEISRLIRQLR